MAPIRALGEPVVDLLAERPYTRAAVAARRHRAQGRPLLLEDRVRRRAQRRPARRPQRELAGDVPDRARADRHPARGRCAERARRRRRRRRQPRRALRARRDRHVGAGRAARRRVRGLGARGLGAAAARSPPAATTSTSRPPTRARSASARATAPTTSGCSRSSAPTTRTTSSARTATSALGAQGAAERERRGADRRGHRLGDERERRATASASAATTVPSRSITGAATPSTPRRDSSRLIATPRSRISASAAGARSGSVIVPGPWRSRPRAQSASTTSGANASSSLARGGHVRRQAAADARRHRRGEPARELLEPDRVGAVEHGERDDLVRGRVQVAHERQRRLGQPRTLRDELAELEQPQARAHAARDALQPAPLEQPRDRAVHGRQRELGAAGELADRQRVGVERVEHGEHVPLRRTHGRTAWQAGGMLAAMTASRRSPRTPRPSVSALPCAPGSGSTSPARPPSTAPARSSAATIPPRRRARCCARSAPRSRRRAPAFRTSSARASTSPTRPTGRRSAARTGRSFADLPPGGVDARARPARPAHARRDRGRRLRAVRVAAGAFSAPAPPAAAGARRTPCRSAAACPTRRACARGNRRSRSSPASAAGSAASPTPGTRPSARGAAAASRPGARCGGRRAGRRARPPAHGEPSAPRRAQGQLRAEGRAARRAAPQGPREVGVDRLLAARQARARDAVARVALRAHLASSKPPSAPVFALATGSQRPSNGHTSRWSSTRDVRRERAFPTARRGSSVAAALDDLLLGGVDGQRGRRGRDRDVRRTRAARRRPDRRRSGAAGRDDEDSRRRRPARSRAGRRCPSTRARAGRSPRTSARRRRRARARPRSRPRSRRRRGSRTAAAPRRRRRSPPPSAVAQFAASTAKTPPVGAAK